MHTAQGCLTLVSKASTLVTVVARNVISALLSLALGVYAFDCAPMATAQQAMQCCKSMRCMSHHRQGEDCCKTMPTTQVDVGQPTSVNHSLPHVAVGVVQTFDESLSISASVRFVADQSHAPPIVSPPSVLPLRI
jgi:hypothetical protein